MGEILSFLESCLSNAGLLIGQVFVSPEFELRHGDDLERHELEAFLRVEDARLIARYDDQGQYRPLKTAPNLRHGWSLQLGSAAEVHLALDSIYPAALGTWIAFKSGMLAPVSLRQTLGRQTGMYRVTQLITDSQAETLIGSVCHPGTGCLRKILWKIQDDVAGPFHDPSPVSSEANGVVKIPVLCAEACNLLVAACRPIAKQNLPAGG